jgi:hypothetical protein
MRKDARIRVSVVEPLPYETLSLDPVSFQAAPPTDQTQGFITALLPSLKGVSTPVLSPKSQLLRRTIDSTSVANVKEDINRLGSYLDNPFPTVQTFIAHAQVLYAQFQEAIAPLPRPRNASDQPVRAAAIPAEAPYPWSTPYHDWLSVLLCELSSADSANDVNPAFTDLMVGGISVQTLLTPPTQLREHQQLRHQRLP